MVGFVSVPGALGLIIAAIVFHIAWKQTKNIVGSILWLVGSFLTVYILAAFVIFPFLFEGSRASAQSCYKAAGSDAKALAMCNTMTSGIVPSSSSNSSQQPSQNLQPQPQGQPTPAPQISREWKRDGLKILSANWNLLPGDWPSKSMGQLVGPGSLPVGVKARLFCTNCGVFINKSEERWSLVLTESTGIMDQVNLIVNGYFAREQKSGFNANPDGSESAGTGTWEGLCTGCYVDTIIIPPAPKWWEVSGVQYPYHFPAVSITAAGENFDACGWASSTQIIKCTDDDKPGSGRQTVDPADYPNLPHP